MKVTGDDINESMWKEVEFARWNGVAFRRHIMMYFIYPEWLDTQMTFPFVYSE